MTRTFHKVGDKVYYEDSSEPGVYRKISGYDFANAPSNAIQVGPNLYNTPENIELMKQAEAYFAKQGEEQKKQEQVEASKSQTQVTSVPHVTSPEYHTYLESQEKQEKENEIARKIAGKIAPTIVKDATGKIMEKVKEEEKQIPHHSEEHLYTGSQILFDSQNRKVIFDPNSRTFVPVTPEKETAQKIANVIAPTIAINSIKKIIDKIKKETVEAPSLRETKIDELLSKLKRQGVPTQVLKSTQEIATAPTTKDFFKRISEIDRWSMPIIDDFSTMMKERSQAQEVPIYEPIQLAMPYAPSKKIAVAFAGGIAPILARVGTALWDFVSKNPKTIGATISTTALSNAITQTAQTEQEKNQIIKEIAEQNPQLASEIVQAKTSPFANMADIGKYAVLGIIGILILYILSKK